MNVRSDKKNSKMIEPELPIDHKQLKAICGLRGNQRCCDCSSQTVEWGSVTFGVLLCISCAGKHRGLGVQVSFVRSLHMDTWSRSQIEQMKNGGNGQLHEFFENKGIDYTRLQASVLYSSEEASTYKNALKTHVRNVCEGKESSSPDKSSGDGNRIRSPVLNCADMMFQAINSNTTSNDGSPTNISSMNGDDNINYTYSVRFLAGPLGITMKKDTVSSTRALITQIASQSQADKKGVRAGDYILFVDATAVGYTEAHRALQNQPRPIDVTFVRPKGRLVGTHNLATNMGSNSEGHAKASRSSISNGVANKLNINLSVISQQRERAGTNPSPTPTKGNSKPGSSKSNGSRTPSKNSSAGGTPSSKGSRRGSATPQDSSGKRSSSRKSTPSSKGTGNSTPRGTDSGGQTPRGSRKSSMASTNGRARLHSADDVTADNRKASTPISGGKVGTPRSNTTPTGSGKHNSGSGSSGKVRRKSSKGTSRKPNPTRSKSDEKTSSNRSTPTSITGSPDINLLSLQSKGVDSSDGMSTPSPRSRANTDSPTALKNLLENSIRSASSGDGNVEDNEDTRRSKSMDDGDYIMGNALKFDRIDEHENDSSDSSVAGIDDNEESPKDCSRKHMSVYDEGEEDDDIIDESESDFTESTKSNSSSIFTSSTKSNYSIYSSQFSSRTTSGRYSDPYGYSGHSSANSSRANSMSSTYVSKLIDKAVADGNVYDDDEIYGNVTAMESHNGQVGNNGDNEAHTIDGNMSHGYQDSSEFGACDTLEDGALLPVPPSTGFSRSLSLPILTPDDDLAYSIMNPVSPREFRVIFKSSPLGLTLTKHSHLGTAQVTKVLEGGQAQRLGVRLGDIVVGVDDEWVGSYDEVMYKLTGNKAAYPFKLVFRRITQIRNGNKEAVAQSGDAPMVSIAKSTK